MELKKITKHGPRRYEDACGTAHALDILGERWALLVIRELLLGPRRFGELRASLPGVSANVLTQRLEGLEAAGVVCRERLPSPASVQVYALTEWGREAEPIVLGLGRWGARSPFQNTTMPLSPVSMMLSFRAMFDAERARGVDLALTFHLGAESFRMAVRDGKLDGGRGEAEGADVTLSGEPGAVAAAVYGLKPLEELEGQGALVISGDRAAFSRFAACFELPPKSGTAEGST